MASTTSSRFDRAAEENEAALAALSGFKRPFEALKKAREVLRSASESTSAASSNLMSKTRERFSTVMDASSRAVDFLGDDHKKAEKTKQSGASAVGQ